MTGPHEKGSGAHQIEMAVARETLRRVWTGREGYTDRPACPNPSDCRQKNLGPTGGIHGWNVYCCEVCGDEEWL